MPLVTIDVIEHVFSPTQKKEIIEQSRTRWSPSKASRCAR